MDPSRETLADHELHWLTKLEAARAQVQAEIAAAQQRAEKIAAQLAGFSAYLGWRYQLGPADAVTDDGQIHRAPTADELPA